MGWVKTEHKFPRRRNIFTVRSWKIKSFLEAADDSPDEIEKRLRQLLLAYRPSLEGCTIDFMNYNQFDDQWEIGVTHPTLQAVSEESVSTRIPLIEDHDA